MAERVGEKDFEAKVKQAECLVLTEFYSDSCIPCKQLSPVLGEIEEEYAGKVRSGSGPEKRLAEKGSIDRMD